MKNTFLLIFYSMVLSGNCTLVLGQEIIELGGPKMVSRSENLPLNLTSSRSVVIISTDDIRENFTRRGEWEKLAGKVHANLRKMNIDGVWFICYDDLFAGPEIKYAIINELNQRGVENIILFDQQKLGLQNYYSLKISRFSKSAALINPGDPVWIEESEDFDRLFLRLGRSILQQELLRTNFLIPETPFIVKDVPFFEGIQLSNYPGQLRRATLGVVIPHKIPEPDHLSNQQIDRIREYNVQIEKHINEMERIFERYPYKYQFIEFQNDEQLYKSGFQFVLMPLHSTGKTIKGMLNYKNNGTETDYISIVPQENGGVNLKTIPVNAVVHKYYIKQTIAHDVHVGNHWDSDTTWQAALKNYILNLTNALK